MNALSAWMHYAKYNGKDMGGGCRQRKQRWEGMRDVGNQVSSVLAVLWEKRNRNVEQHRGIHSPWCPGVILAHPVGKMNCVSMWREEGWMSSLNECSIWYWITLLKGRANPSQLWRADAIGGALTNLLLWLEFMPYMCTPWYMDNSTITHLHRCAHLSCSHLLAWACSPSWTKVIQLPLLWEKFSFLYLITQAAMPTTVCILQITLSINKKRTVIVKIIPLVLCTEISKFVPLENWLGHKLF